MAQKYIGDLRESLHNLRNTLVTHPLIHTLRDDNAQLKRTNKAQRDEINEMRRVTIPNEVRRAVESEKRTSAKSVKLAEAQRDTMQRNLDIEKVRWNTTNKALMDRQADLMLKMEQTEK